MKGKHSSSLLIVALITTSFLLSCSRTNPRDAAQNVILHISQPASIDELANNLTNPTAAQLGFALWAGLDIKINSNSNEPTEENENEARAFLKKHNISVISDFTTGDTASVINKKGRKFLRLMGKEARRTGHPYRDLLLTAFRQIDPEHISLTPDGSNRFQVQYDEPGPNPFAKYNDQPVIRKENGRFRLHMGDLNTTIQEHKNPAKNSITKIEALGHKPIQDVETYQKYLSKPAPTFHGKQQTKNQLYAVNLSSVLSPSGASKLFFELKLPPVPNLAYINPITGAVNRRNSDKTTLARMTIDQLNTGSKEHCLSDFMEDDRSKIQLMNRTQPTPHLFVKNRAVNLEEEGCLQELQEMSGRFVLQLPMNTRTETVSAKELPVTYKNDRTHFTLQQKETNQERSGRTNVFLRQLTYERGEDHVVAIQAVDKNGRYILGTAFRNNENPNQQTLRIFKKEPVKYRVTTATDYQKWTTSYSFPVNVETETFDFNLLNRYETSILGNKLRVTRTKYDKDKDLTVVKLSYTGDPNQIIQVSTTREKNESDEQSTNVYYQYPFGNYRVYEGKITAITVAIANKP